MNTYFDREQKNAILAGEDLQKDLEQFLTEVCDPKSERSIRHAGLFGSAGMRKSFLSELKAVESGLPFDIIKGQASLFGMAQNLAVLKVKHGDSPVIIIIDDCDKLFVDADSINTMKELLGPTGMFSYSKNLHLNSIPEGAKRDAVEVFMSDDATGFQIDCTNFRFIITSNTELPSIKTLRTAKARLGDKPTTPSVQKLDHLHAIRTRIRYKRIEASLEEVWGSIAYVLLSTDMLTQRTEEEKKIILNWMWSHRHDMTEFNVRTTIDMSDDIDALGIEDSLDRWMYNYVE